MTTPTDAELLDAVKSAIRAILTGQQAYSVNGLQVTRADLRTLIDMRRDLEARMRAADATTNGNVTQVSFGDPEGDSTRGRGCR